MKSALILSALLCALCGSTLAADKPDILLIYADDHGWADLGAQGADKDIRTPHLDQLATDGVDLLPFLTGEAKAARLEAKLKTWTATLQPPGPPEPNNDQDNGFYADHVTKTAAPAPKSRGKAATTAHDPFRGWICRNGTLAVKDGALILTPEAAAKGAPFLARAALDLPGPVTVTLRARASTGGKAAASWRTSHQKDFTAEQPDLVRELNTLITGFLQETEAVVPKLNRNFKAVPAAPANQAGWQTSKDAQLRIAPGELKITSTGGDPWISTRDLPAGAKSPFTRKLRLRSTGGGNGVVYFTDKARGGFKKERSVSFPLKHDGQPHDREVQLPIETLAALRLDPGNAKGEIVITSLTLHDVTRAVVKAWPSARPAR